MARLLLEDASVEFPMPFRIKDLARDTSTKLLGGSMDYSRRSIRALNNINLDIKPGERLGIIGHNGAGKTTLLRVLAGIYQPTSGTARIEGRISTLISAAPGIDLEESGLDNIRSCALYFGMSRQEIARKIDDIAAFTELDDYLQMPVRIYSAGMLTRLSFAIATAIDPEILIMDEGLATGDAAFVQKAERRVMGLINRAAIVVVASHSSAMLKNMCTHGIALQKGHVIASGPIAEVIDSYFRHVIEGAQQGDQNQLSTALAVATDLVQRGEKVPLEIEEQSLWAALRLLPDDRTMRLRLCHVLRLQNKEVPNALRIYELECELAHRPADSAGLAELRRLQDVSTTAPLRAAS